MTSEVAQLRQRIEEEIIAMHLLMTGPAISGRHAIINRRYSNLATYHQELTGLIGGQAAEMIVNETYDQIMEGDGRCNNQR